MRIFNKKDTQKKATTKLPMTGKVRTGFRRYCVAVLALTMVLGTSMTAFAEAYNAADSALKAEIDTWDTTYWQVTGGAISFVDKSAA